MLVGKILHGIDSDSLQSQSQNYKTEIEFESFLVHWRGLDMKHFCTFWFKKKEAFMVWCSLQYSKSCLVYTFASFIHAMCCLYDTDLRLTFCSDFSKDFIKSKREV